MILRVFCDNEECDLGEAANPQRGGRQLRVAQRVRLALLPHIPEGCAWPWAGHPTSACSAGDSATAVLRGGQPLVGLPG